MLRYKNHSIAWVVIFTFLFSSLAGTGIFNPKPSFARHAGEVDWQEHPNTTVDDPKDTNPDEDPNQDEAGDDPVNIASGNFIHRQQDLFIPGRLPLEISRTYNCQDMYEGPFGYGWSFTYNVTLTEVIEGAEEYVIIKQGDGKRLDFKDNGDGTYTSPVGYYCQLSKTAGGYVLTEKNSTKYNFDTSGNLTSIIDRNDNQIALNYDGTGKLSTVSDDAGRTLTFSYGTNNKIATITDPAGRTFTYGYDSNDNLISYTDPAGNTTQYAYDSQHRLTTITDPKSTTFLTNTYDSEDRVTRQDYYGGTYYYYYYPDSKYTRVRNPRGYYTYHYYNDTGNPTTTRDALGNSTVRTWDANINLTSLKDARSYTTSYTYDSVGNFLTITDPQGNVTTFTYESTYNQVTSITDPLDRVTSFEYDSKGNLTRITDAIGNQTTFTYDTNGDLLSTSNADGKSTSFVYDTYGYLTTITDALGNKTNFTYNILGNLGSVTDQNGNTTQYGYDQLNQLNQITDALNNTTKFIYDANGNRAAIVDALNNSTAFAYNAWNHLTAITDVLGNQTSFTYDANGNTLSVTDAEGNSTTNAYDALDRLTKVTDALNNATEYTYDKNGNLTSIKDAKGNTTTYTYDSLNRLTKTTYPNGSTETYAYNKVGNLVSKTDQKGNTINYSYDNLNRLSTKSYPDTTQATYAYDVLSRLTSTANINSTISYSYDALNRVIQVTQDGKTVGYEYDGAGNRTRLSYPDGSYITYSYDALNCLDQIKNSTGQAIADYTYDNLSRRTQLDLANGTQALYQYDQISRLTNLTNRIASIQAIISSFAYTYDKTSNRTSTSTIEGTHSYTYDKTYQLISVNYPDGYPFSYMTYNFDVGGNRTSTVNGGTTTYTTNNMNQYTDVGGTAYIYDANGNLTGDAINTYSYDYDNRLLQATNPTNTITFTYDPLGRRISKTDSTGATRYIYDSDQVVMETDGVGTTIADYVYGKSIDEVLTMKRNTGTYYYHFDGTGSVTEISDSTGFTVESYKYDAYGQFSIFDGSGDSLSGSAIDNSYMFTGRRYDEETDSYYYRARYYNPKTGSFMQKDLSPYEPGDPRLMNISLFNHPLLSIVKSPIVISQWLAFDQVLTDMVGFTGRSGHQALMHYPLSYHYANNNPVNYTDPEGRWLIPVLVIVGAAYLGYKVYKAVKNFGEKVDKFKKTDEKFWENPTGETYRNRARAFADALGAGVEMGATIPGTSLSGPPPTSATSIISGAAQSALIDTLSNPGGKPE